MAIYHVEMTGECREVYEVEADTEQDAMARWADGTHLLTEAIAVEPVSARLIEDTTSTED